MARNSRKSVVPGSSTRLGASDKDDRHIRPSSTRRRSRSPSPGPSGSGNCHISMTREGRASRSRKRESNSYQRRNYSREAEQNIPGFTSEATRRSRTDSTTTIMDRRFSPDRRSYSSFHCSRRDRRRSHSRSRRRTSRRDSRERRHDSWERRYDNRVRRSDHRDQEWGHLQPDRRHHH